MGQRWAFRSHKDYMLNDKPTIRWAFLLPEFIGIDYKDCPTFFRYLNNYEFLYKKEV